MSSMTQRRMALSFYGLKKRIGIIESIAVKHRKLPAVGEIGFNRLPYPIRLMDYVAPAFASHRFSQFCFGAMQF
jgi:hypothetical protein